MYNICQLLLQLHNSLADNISYSDVIVKGLMKV